MRNSGEAMKREEERKEKNVRGGPEENAEKRTQ
jgi:hypothetical protein